MAKSKLHALQNTQYMFREKIFNKKPIVSQYPATKKYKFSMQPRPSYNPSLTYLPNVSVNWKSSLCQVSSWFPTERGRGRMGRGRSCAHSPCSTSWWPSLRPSLAHHEHFTRKQRNIDAFWYPRLFSPDANTRSETYWWGSDGRGPSCKHNFTDI